MMNKKVFAAIVWNDKSITFFRTKPFNCTFDNPFLLII